MKKVMLFLGLVGLIAGLAQAQTPQVRLLWERTFPAKVTLAMDAGDTVTGPVFTGWHKAGKFVTMDKNGTITEFPIDTTKKYYRLATSRSGRFLLQSWYQDFFREVATSRMDKPYRVQVRDRSGSVVSTLDGCFADQITDNGTLVWPGPDSVVVYGLDGHVKGRAGLAPGRAQLYPLFITDDGNRIMVSTLSPDGRSVIVFDSTGRKIVEVSGVEQNSAMRRDGGLMVTQQVSATEKKALFYDSEGRLQASYALHGIDNTYGDTPISFSEDGNFACVVSYKKLALLQISPPKIVWEYTMKLPRPSFRECLVGPDGKYVVAREVKPNKLILFNEKGAPLESSDYGSVSLKKNYLLMTQGSVVRLFKIEQ